MSPCHTRLADKHASLFFRLVGDEERRFYTVDEGVDGERVPSVRNRSHRGRSGNQEVSHLRTIHLSAGKATFTRLSDIGAKRHWRERH